MGKKKSGKTKPVAQTGSASSKEINKPLIKAMSAKEGNKKKRRFKPQKIKSNDPTGNLQKLVANVKRPKEVVSGNWQAFLSSGLADSPKKVKKPYLGRKFRDNPSQSVTKLPDSSAIELLTVTEEAYTTAVDPQSDEQKHDLTRCIAMDCEMVGVNDGKESVLARVSLVNQHGECVYDKFVKSKEEVVDYRTKVSGIRASDLKRGEHFEIVQKEVAAILSGKILVGHALRNDMKVLMLNHPLKTVRDTSRFRPFRSITSGRTPSLKKLASEVLGVTIQSGEHSSVEDAKAAMQLYNLYQKEWEDHRLQRKVLRRKNSIAAALGQPKVLPKNSKKTLKVTKNPLLDEFAAF